MSAGFNTPTAARRRTRAVILSLVFFSLFLAFAAPSPAQESEPARQLVGQVLLGGVAVPGAPVSLHEVSSGGSGEVATGVTDEQGAFRFDRASAGDIDFAFYFATAEHESVTFFGPIMRAEETPDNYVIEVFDTATVLPEPVRVNARHMVLIPENTGSWEVNEILRVVNPTSLALVSPDGSAAWSFSIPDGVTDFEVGPGDVLPHELALMENRVLHLTPLIPGAREVLIRYRLPADASPGVVRITEPTDSFNLYVRQPAHLSGVTGLQSQRMVELDDEQYLQYSATALPAGEEIGMRWSRPGPPVDPVKAAVGVSALILGIAAAMAFRNRGPAAPEA